MKKADLKYIDISLIDENEINSDIYEMNDIDYLAEMIKENGFNSPITVTEKEGGRYEIVSGHRRYRAMKLLKAKEVPACIVDFNSDSDKKKQLLSSNITSRVISPYEMANQIMLYEEILKEKGFKGNKRQEVARFFNISDSKVQRYRVLLNLIPELKELTKRPNFPYSSLRAIAPLDEDKQREVYRNLEILKANQLKNSKAIDSDMVETNIDDSVYNRVVIEQIVQNVIKNSENANVTSREPVNINGTTYKNNSDIKIEDIDNIRIDDCDDVQEIIIDDDAKNDHIIANTREVLYKLELLIDEIHNIKDQEIEEVFHLLCDKVRAKI